MSRLVVYSKDTGDTGYRTNLRLTALLAFVSLEAASGLRKWPVQRPADSSAQPWRR